MKKTLIGLIISSTTLVLVAIGIIIELVHTGMFDEAGCTVAACITCFVCAYIATYVKEKKEIAEKEEIIRNINRKMALGEIK